MPRVAVGVLILNDSFAFNFWLIFANKIPSCKYKTQSSVDSVLRFLYIRKILLLLETKEFFS